VATLWALHEAVISLIRVRYGALAIGRGVACIRYRASH
jgi:hypothetical protein